MIKLSTNTAYDGKAHRITASYNKYTIGFGIFAWPWVPRFYYYRTLAAQIYDMTGILNWLVHFRYREPDGYRFVHFRLLCVGVGFQWEVSDV